MIGPMTANEDRIPDGVERVRADNPSPLTLDGTNTYVVEHWVVDPGPADPAHLDALVEAAGGTVEGIVLTHDHSDHSEGADPLAERTGAPVVRPRGGERHGPFETIATPGHAPDHVALLAGRALFTGDTVLGTGSVFIMPGEGSLAAYLDSLRRLRELEVDAILPGHGPVVWDPRAKLDEYIAHRLDRERRVLDGLAAGARTRDELLDSAWSDVDFAAQPYLRYAAAATLEAHLEKLEEEGRLPGGVERGGLDWLTGA
jgi:glyoxylase-like metal-dependent hydrolase (beta-lactamase superfamily II)